MAILHSQATVASQQLWCDLFWFYDGYSPGPHSKERLMPDGVYLSWLSTLKETMKRGFIIMVTTWRYALPSGALLLWPRHSSFFDQFDTAQIKLR